VREHEIEPVPGLPEELPKGEAILWQGTPDWRDIALRVLHVRGVAVYFAALFGYLGWAAYQGGAPVEAAVMTTLRPVPIAAGAIVFLGLIAYAIARTTMYTITSQRIVMRFGLALPMTVNIPYGLVQAANLSEHGRCGDLALDLNAPRQSLIVLWPHVRPWHTTKPQPMMRSLADARVVATTLAGALRAFHGANATVTRTETAPANDLVHTSEHAAA
jgi:hypothetical protein